MECFWSYDSDIEQPELNNHVKIISKLEGARDKLSPIVDNIILSAVDSIERGDSSFLNECELSVAQCQDIVWASTILKDIQYKSVLDNRVHKWPNTDILVNNVSVGYPKNMNSSRSKTIVIDEVTVLKLLEIYEQMGQVIQIFMNEYNRQNEEDNVVSTTSATSVRHSQASVGNIIRSASNRFPSAHSQRHISRSHEEMRASSTSLGEDLNPPQIERSLSALRKSSSRDLNKPQSVHHSRVDVTEIPEEDTNIYIKIQCYSDLSDSSENTQPVVLPANCDNQSTPHYHIKLGGQPVTLKVNQNNVEEGAIYCINTGSDGENDIRIVIKQCPECFSTVIGSTTKIKDMLGESHESITLHGKSMVDESGLPFSSTDESSTEEVPSRSQLHISTTDNDTNIIVADIDEDTEVKVSKMGSGSRIAIKSGTSRGSKSPFGSKIPTASDLHQPSSRSKSKQFSDTRSVTKSKTHESKVPTSSHLHFEDGGRSRSRPLSETRAVSRSRTISRTGTVDHSGRISESRPPSDSRVLSTTRSPSGSRVLSIPRSPTASQTKISQPHLDVLIDTENVDRSSIQFNGDVAKPESFHTAEPSITDMRSTRGSSRISPVPSSLPLTRRRVCSSMEFDVSTVHTRLREHDVEHSNPHIVVELRKMGVDTILRACRPARCCRKAILDERQRTGLPYCVSLKSLPLMGNDIEVIKQSYDMSIKKIKNAIDLTNHRETLAYYIGLGKDDFKPNINFPWVVPLYGVKLNAEIPKEAAEKERFFILKSDCVETTKEIQKKACKKKKPRSEKFFVLKKISESSASTVSTVKIRRRSKRKVKRRMKVKFKVPSKINVSSKNYLDRIKKWNQSPAEFNKKYLHTNILGDIDRMFCKTQNTHPKYEDLFSDFNKKKFNLLGNFAKSDSDLSEIYNPLAGLLDLDFSACEKKNWIAKCEMPSTSTKNILESGDYSFSSACRILDGFLEKIENESYSVIRPRRRVSDTDSSIIKRTRCVSMTSFSTIWSHVSEKVFYTSSDVTIFLKRRQSVGKIQKTTHSRKNKKVDNKACKRKKLAEIKKSEKQALEPTPPKKLEYYVSLVNGDLVWGKSTPLLPQNYSTYYNHDNITSGEQTPVHQSSTLDEIPYTRQYSGSRSILPPRPPETSQPINAQKLNKKVQPTTSAARSAPSVGKPTATSSPQIRKSLEPESPYQPWAPFLISVTSLPQVKEEPQKIAFVEKVEAKPVKEEPKQVPVQPVLARKVCDASTCRKMKKHCGQGLIIDIRKSGTAVETKAAGSKCNKEVCELYKNKLLLPDKSNSSKVDFKADKQYTVIGKNNIKIVIDSKNISVSKKKCTKSKDGKCMPDDDT